MFKSVKQCQDIRRDETGRDKDNGKGTAMKEEWTGMMKKKENTCNTVKRSTMHLIGVLEGEGKDNAEGIFNNGWNF